MDVHTHVPEPRGIINCFCALGCLPSPGLVSLLSLSLSPVSLSRLVSRAEEVLLGASLARLASAACAPWRLCKLLIEQRS